MQNEWGRYQCQLALPAFGKEGQRKLQAAKVLVVGAGGLGCPCAQYLAASGVGTLCIADFDLITISNLHRQILYTHHEIGLAKAVVASKKLQAQNTSITVLPLQEKITTANALGIIAMYDIVVDATDNFDTKYLLNDACVLMKKPLVYAAIYQYEAQLAVFNVLNEVGTYTSNYRDLFPAVNATAVPNCAEGGVMPTIAGIMGCMQANEVIKYIVGMGELLTEKLLIINAQTLQTHIINTYKTTRTSITELPATTTAVPQISPTDLYRAMPTNAYQLVDVRTLAERKQFHIGGQHLPTEEALTAHADLMECNKPIVFYCASGKRSTAMVRQMKEKFPGRHFFSLEGGIEAWKLLQLPMDTNPHSLVE